MPRNFPAPAPASSPQAAPATPGTRAVQTVDDARQGVNAAVQQSVPQASDNDDSDTEPEANDTYGSFLEYKSLPDIQKRVDGYMSTVKKAMLTLFCVASPVTAATILVPAVGLKKLWWKLKDSYSIFGKIHHAGASVASAAAEGPKSVLRLVTRPLGVVKDVGFNVLKFGARRGADTLRGINRLAFAPFRILKDVFTHHEGEPLNIVEQVVQGCRKLVGWYLHKFAERPGLTAISTAVAAAAIAYTGGPLLLGQNIIDSLVSILQKFAK